MKTRLTILGLFFTAGLCAQQVSCSFDKQKILLGEPVKLSVQATVRNDGLSLPFGIDSLPHFEVLDRSKIDTVIRGGLLQLSQTLTITSWDSGRWSLPSLLIDTVASKLITIEVGYTSPWNPKQPYNDIKGIIPVKRPEKQTWWWYVIGAAILVALFLLFFPSGRKAPAAVQLDSGAYKKAMQALNDLQKKDRTEGNAKPYYTALIVIFRTYLKSGKGIQSFSKTTSDLGLQLQTVKMDKDEYNRLLQTLRLSDLVKFAQYQPNGEVNAAALETIKGGITAIEQGYAV